jgi:putative transposase
MAVMTSAEHFGVSPKQLVVVKRHHPRVVLPAASTVGQILKKQGLIGRPRRVRRSEPYGERPGPYDAPNRVWCVDIRATLQWARDAATH